MEDYEEERKIMVDACIFLEIILQQTLTAECEEEIQSIRNKKDILCVTPEIIHEIMKGIESGVEIDIESTDFVRPEKKEKRKRELFFNHLETFKRLLHLGGRILFLGDGLNPKTCFDECVEQIRLSGGPRGLWDRIHIASAISNKCVEFITKDGPIGNKGNRRAIRLLSGGKMEVILIGDKS